MKKKLIAASAASLAVAAMPMVGVFAETSVTTTDTVTVTVPFGCTVNSRTGAGTTAAFGEVAPGADGVNKSTDAIVINCNKAWVVTPSTDGLTASGGTTITSATANGKGSQFKVALAASSTEGVSNGFTSQTAIGGTTPATVTGSASASNLSLTPTYSIHIGDQQEQGSYTGTVTYTIALGA